MSKTSVQERSRWIHEVQLFMFIQFILSFPFAGSHIRLFFLGGHWCGTQCLAKGKSQLLSPVPIKVIMPHFDDLNGPHKVEGILSCWQAWNAVGLMHPMSNALLEAMPEQVDPGILPHV